MAKLEISTQKRVEIVNVTREVSQALDELGIGDGLLMVSVRHTTCGVCINEDEAGLRRDFERLGGTLLDPFRGGGYHHDQIDDNAQAHLTAVLLGNSVQIPISDGQPVLGTWQRILLMELDGPRSRALDLTVLGS